MLKSSRYQNGLKLIIQSEYKFFFIVKLIQFFFFLIGQVFNLKGDDKFICNNVTQLLTISAVSLV